MKLLFKSRSQYYQVKKANITLCCLILFIIFSLFPFSQHEILHRNLIDKRLPEINPKYASNVEIYENITWKSQFDDPIRQLHSQNLYTKITVYAHALVREVRMCYHFQNVYFSAWGIAQNQYNIKFAQYIKKQKEYLEPSPNPWEYYNKIVMAYSHHLEYGHFMGDMLSALIQMPQEYLRDADIFINFNEKPARKICGILGFNESRIHKLPKYWTYALDVRVIVSKEGANALLVNGLKILHEKFYAALNLSSIVPNRYIFLNRIKGIWGTINNLPELFESAKTNFPKYNWEIANESIAYSTIDAGKLLAHTKFLITTAGSMNFNCVFMQKGTAVCVCGSKCLDYPAIAVHYAMGIWSIYTNGFLLHGKVDTKPFPVDKFNTAVSLLLEAQETGKWPKSAAKDYIYAWPINTIKWQAEKGYRNYPLRPQYYRLERKII
ncbi:hypothetical protein TVAG_121980 [Trichomonas vaginalis G3]|uniref:Glycosyltransferase 61 catalytic domain-containing protein n=1 Tax=Trichomonas vaginalis (strain ATCC PRA-98 / G3) TaxID=412133 RepID=A2E9A9_TRIV3|nr:glycosyltransferase family [Trichomonas vaginalis G3]EAY10794.1 hypothetical protein TVAG_121980 [Trichomonas vaginalis G3]KAI5536066.1 glycosyltransferase family [Trichomonas vaginalis G3]|eukprot:XP_001323017.1 hypothetical protein [Trichomonas vaginalis G3]